MRDLNGLRPMQPIESSHLGHQSGGKGFHFSPSSLDATRILSTLWARKFIILAFAFIGAVYAVFYVTYLVTPIYSTSATVVLTPRQERVVDVGNIFGEMSADTLTINTEEEILKSRSLLGRVVDDLDLIDDPEFNSALREPRLTDRIRARIQGRSVGVRNETPEAARARVISRLSQSTSASNIPLTLVFNITVRSEDRQKAARLADAIAKAYVDQQLDKKYDVSEQASVWLTNQVAELKASLETAEARVQAFSSSANLISQENLIAQEVQLKEIRGRIATAEINVRAMQDQQSQLDAASSRSEIVAILQDDAVLQRLDDTGSDQGNDAFDRAVAQHTSALGIAITRRTAQSEALKASERRLAESVEKQSADLIQLQQLTRDAEATRLLYEHFLTRLKETSAQQGIHQPDSSVLSQAVVPSFPAEPRKRLTVMFYTLVFGSIGAILALWQEQRRTTILTAEDLELASGYTVMGQLPKLSAKTRRGVVGNFVNDTTSSAAEAVRNLRTSILLSRPSQDAQIIGLTSAAPGEGKTTVSFALAANFASLGKRTLLIEGDMRRNIFAHYTDAAHQTEADLFSILDGEATLKDAINHNIAGGYDILSSGRKSSRRNPGDLVGSTRMMDLLEGARRSYDVVILDTPPVLAVPDARMMATMVDVMLLVVNWNTTPLWQIRQSLQMFESVGTQISGLVLNQINWRKMGRYGYGDRYGAYTTYGAAYHSGK